MIIVAHKAGYSLAVPNDLFERFVNRKMDWLQVIQEIEKRAKQQASRHRFNGSFFRQGFMGQFNRTFGR